MRTPSLHPKIAADLKRIARRLFNDEDYFIEQKWQDLKDDIKDLADECDRTGIEEVERRRLEDLEFANTTGEKS
jgi:hypothetical protein